MEKDLWLPRGYELEDGSRIGALLVSGNDWQIIDTNGWGNLLLARPELVRRWWEVGLLDESLFGEIFFGAQLLRSIRSDERYTLSPVASRELVESNPDALAFASALRESRKLLNDASFHDAIYVEQYSRLLPTWTLTPQVDDKVVLGSWITGGVAISTDSFRRLTNLVGWMSATELVEIVRHAGFNLPTGAQFFADQKSQSKIGADKKAKVAEDTAVHEKSSLRDDIVEDKVFRLPGRPQLETFFNEYIIDIIHNPDKYQKMGIDFPSAIVLQGPPGCGKTFATERLIDFIDWPNYSIDSNSVGSPYIHETSKKISQVFDEAINNAPSIVVVDEMESFLSSRRSGSSSGLHHIEEVAEFLRRIPEAIESKVLIIAMTNMIDIVDPAILRRGRFDHIIEVGMPSKEEVTELVHSLLGKLPTGKNLNIDKLVSALTGRALSDSAFLIREAARIAAKSGKAHLEQEDIDAALEVMPRDNEEKSRSIGFVREQ